MPPLQPFTTVALVDRICKFFSNVKSKITLKSTFQGQITLIQINISNGEIQGRLLHMLNNNPVKLEYFCFNIFEVTSATMLNLKQCLKVYFKGI
jgi:hypothetical protein